MFAMIIHFKYVFDKLNTRPRIDEPSTFRIAISFILLEV